MNNCEVAKDFVVAFIRAGKINSMQQAIERYQEACALFNKRSDFEAPTQEQETYKPFK